MTKAGKWVILPVYVSQNDFGQKDQVLLLELRTAFGSSERVETYSTDDYFSNLRK